MKWLVLILVLGIALLLNSCENSECKIDESVLAINDSVLSQDSLTLELKTYWTRFDEPDLRNVDHEAFRLQIYHSLGRGLKIIRLDSKDDAYTLNQKSYYTAAGNNHDEDSLVIEFTKLISEEQWDDFTSLIEDSCFWTLIWRNDEMYLDGEKYLLEGRTPNADNCTQRSYHLVGRESLNDTKFKSICDKLIELSKKD